MGTLPTPETPLVNRAHLGGIAAPEHLDYQAIIVAAIVPRVGACKAVPMVGKGLCRKFSFGLICSMLSPYDQR